MKKLLIKLRLIICDGLRDIYYFGFKVMFANTYCTLTDDSLKSIVHRNQILLQWLTKHNRELLENYKQKGCEKLDAETAQAPLWIFWWQGRRAMPEIIALCYQSKVRAAGSHPIVLLTKDNVKNYVEFPDYVWEQFSKKKLKIQHLADMIRVQLIAKYGGVWLDASIYCRDKIPESVYQSEIFSLKGPLNNKYVSKCRWTTFAIGGNKNNILCSFLNDFFIRYCKTGKPFINYYMFDCAIAVAYDNLPQVKKEIDKLPMSPNDFYWLSEHLGDTSEEAKEKLKHQTLFQKIAWKNYVENIPGEESLYMYLKRREEEYAES